ncbi:hypothetical protein GCM10010372_31050 [Streptomyces tauricus]|uniref:hypothetical protein n=1 Tax=Streptomyces tauricus TaxID=68274 RepID=UPI001675C8E8|nr:hypothetical protein [Streptomyces tauricus]GHA28950.1 hypothetical protein GCM10010372_31050 [Streptomyces tauricus]
MKRRRHHGKERTANTRTYVVHSRNLYGPLEGSQFATSDRRKAFSEARRHAKYGRLISFTHHLGGGRWEDLTASVTDQPADRITRTFAAVQVLRGEVTAP